MVFLKSSYNAVGIYYFTNNILVAQSVAQDGTYKYIQIIVTRYHNCCRHEETNIIQFYYRYIIIITREDVKLERLNVKKPFSKTNLRKTHQTI